MRAQSVDLRGREEFPSQMKFFPQQIAPHIASISSVYVCSGERYKVETSKQFFLLHQRLRPRVARHLTLCAVGCKRRRSPSVFARACFIPFGDKSHDFLFSERARSVRRQRKQSVVLSSCLFLNAVCNHVFALSGLQLSALPELPQSQVHIPRYSKYPSLTSSFLRCAHSGDTVLWRRRSGIEVHGERRCTAKTGLGEISWTAGEGEGTATRRGGGGG